MIRPPDGPYFRLATNSCLNTWMSRRRGATWIAGALCALLSGCATVSDTAADLVTSNASAIAVLDGRVLWGNANFSIGREASFTLQSAELPLLACAGTLRFTATASGSINFSCSDGRSFTAPFQAMGLLKGSARTLPPGGPSFLLTYGLPVDSAAGYLALPSNQLCAPSSTDSAPLQGPWFSVKPRPGAATRAAMCTAAQ